MGQQAVSEARIWQRGPGISIYCAVACSSAVGHARQAGYRELLHCRFLELLRCRHKVAQRLGTADKRLADALHFATNCLWLLRSGAQRIFTSFHPHDLFSFTLGRQRTSLPIIIKPQLCDWAGL